MTVDRATGGYWEVGADGGVYAYGAPFPGSAGGLHPDKPVVRMVASAGVGGYLLAASGGGVFTYGLPFRASLGGTSLNAPVVGVDAPG